MNQCKLKAFNLNFKVEGFGTFEIIRTLVPKSSFALFGSESRFHQRTAS